MRIFILISTAVLGIVGFAASSLVVIILIATNSTANGKRNYLYPLIPFNAKALLSLVIRVGKRDVEKIDTEN